MFCPLTVKKSIVNNNNENYLILRRHVLFQGPRKVINMCTLHKTGRLILSLNNFYMLLSLSLPSHPLFKVSIHQCSDTPLNFKRKVASFCTQKVTGHHHLPISQCRCIFQSQSAVTKLFRLSILGATSLPTWSTASSWKIA